METFNILYWLGYVDKNGTITFSLHFRGKTEIVSFCEGTSALINAQFVNYPVICLN
jgi:hypothetical protein